MLLGGINTTFNYEIEIEKHDKFLNNLFKDYALNRNIIEIIENYEKLSAIDYYLEDINEKNIQFIINEYNCNRSLQSILVRVDIEFKYNILNIDLSKDSFNINQKYIQDNRNPWIKRFQKLIINFKILQKYMIKDIEYYEYYTRHSFTSWGSFIVGDIFLFRYLYRSIGNGENLTVSNCLQKYVQILH